MGVAGWLLLPHTVDLLQPRVGELAILASASIHWLSHLPRIAFLPQEAEEMEFTFWLLSPLQEFSLTQGFEEVGDYTFSSSVAAPLLSLCSGSWDWRNGHAALGHHLVGIGLLQHGALGIGSADVHWPLNPPRIALPPQGPEGDGNCWDSLQQHKAAGYGCSL